MSSYEMTAEQSGYMQLWSVRVWDVCRQQWGRYEAGRVPASIQASLSAEGRREIARLSAENERICEERELDPSRLEDRRAVNE